MPLRTRSTRRGPKRGRAWRGGRRARRPRVPAASRCQDRRARAGSSSDRVRERAASPAALRASPRASRRAGDESPSSRSSCSTCASTSGGNAPSVVIASRSGRVGLRAELPRGKRRIAPTSCGVLASQLAQGGDFGQNVSGGAGVHGSKSTAGGGGSLPRSRAVSRAVAPTNPTRARCLQGGRLLHVWAHGRSRRASTTLVPSAAAVVAGAGERNRVAVTPWTTSVGHARRRAGPPARSGSPRTLAHVDCCTRPVHPEGREVRAERSGWAK